MRFWLGNQPEMLPADWTWRLEETSPGLYRIRIDRPNGKCVELKDALDAAALEITTSRPEVRKPSS